MGGGIINIGKPGREAVLTEDGQILHRMGVSFSLKYVEGQPNDWFGEEATEDKHTFAAFTEAVPFDEIPAIWKRKFDLLVDAARTPTPPVDFEATVTELWGSGAITEVGLLDTRAGFSDGRVSIVLYRLLHQEYLIRRLT